MTAEQYFRQARRLDKRINCSIAEVKRLREMSFSLMPPALGERVQSSARQDPPFVRCIDRVIDLEKHINSEVEKLVQLREQMRGVIDSIEDEDEQMVLRYRYFHNRTLEEIGDELSLSESTVRRLLRRALDHAVLPENPVRI